MLDSMQMAGMKDVAKTAEAGRLGDLRTFQENEILTYSRVLGHKREVPGSGRWLEISTSTCPPTHLTDWV
jgi:hypothetical protein